jgi:hypothetical protein
MKYANSDFPEFRSRLLLVESTLSKNHFNDFPSFAWVSQVIAKSFETQENDPSLYQHKSKENIQSEKY